MFAISETFANDRTHTWRLFGIFQLQGISRKTMINSNLWKYSRAFCDYKNSSNGLSSGNCYQSFIVPYRWSVSLIKSETTVEMVKNC